MKRIMAGAVVCLAMSMSPAQAEGDMLADYLNRNKQDIQSCLEGDCHPKMLKLMEFVSYLSTLPKKEQVAELNWAINQFPYVSDMDNYGEPEHWATILEFIQNGGDCEDNALIKMTLLNALGWPADELGMLRIPGVELGVPDSDHAVLLFTYDGQDYIADNKDEIGPIGELGDEYQIFRLK